MNVLEANLSLSKETLVWDEIVTHGWFPYTPAAWNTLATYSDTFFQRWKTSAKIAKAPLSLARIAP